MMTIKRLASICSARSTKGCRFTGGMIVLSLPSKRKRGIVSLATWKSPYGPIVDRAKGRVSVKFSCIDIIAWLAVFGDKPWVSRKISSIKVVPKTDLDCDCLCCMVQRRPRG